METVAIDRVLPLPATRPRGTSPRVSRRELLIAVCLLSVLGAAAWGSHVVQGGFYWLDDWRNARLYRFPPESGLLGNADPATREFRPVLAMLLAIPYRLFGLRTELHLALAVLLAVSASASFYWLLRTVGLERVHSASIAALSLLFPWSDSAKLWATGSVNNAALILYFIGLVLSLKGLRRKGWRAATLALAGAALYMLAVLTYEVVGGVVLAGIVVYAWWSETRAALARWLLDLVVVVPTLVYVLLHQREDHVETHSFDHLVSHAGEIGNDAVNLLWSATLPSAVPTVIVAGMVLVVVGGAFLGWLFLPLGDERGDTFGRWLRIGATASIGIVLAYLPFVPGLDKYVPSASGVANRVNLLAAFGYSVLVYALAILAAQLVTSVFRRRALTSFVAIAACLAIAIGYLVRISNDKADWARATRIAEAQLDTISALVPNPKPGTALYSFGDPNYVAPGVPVFTLGADLTHAVIVELRFDRLRAYPMHPTTRWVCDEHRMYPQDSSFGSAQGVRYGLGIFIDMAHHRAVDVQSEADCRLWSRVFGHPPIDEPAR